MSFIPTLRSTLFAGALSLPTAALAQSPQPQEQPAAATPTINESWLTRTPPNPTHSTYPLRHLTIGVGGFIPFADPDQSGGQIDFQLNPVHNRWATIRMTTPRWGILPEKFRGSPVPISFTPYLQLRANREAATTAAGMLVHFFPPQVLSLYIGATAAADIHYPIDNTATSIDIGGNAVVGLQFRIARGYFLAAQLDIPFARYTVSGTDRSNMAATGSVVFRF